MKRVIIFIILFIAILIVVSVVTAQEPPWPLPGGSIIVHKYMPYSVYLPMVGMS